MPNQISKFETIISPLMLRDAHTRASRHSIPLPDNPFTPTPPPLIPTTLAPSHPQTDIDVQPTDPNTLKIAQLNCFNGKVITMTLLANEDFDILLLQEPWINPHTFQLPSHPAWLEFTQYDYKPKAYTKKSRTGIFVSKRFSSNLITHLPSKSALITALEVAIPYGTLPKIRVISAYNPPTHNTGLPELQTWLQNHNDRRTATMVGVDGNLHHPTWNQSGYRHTHPKAKDLIRICGEAGFKINSQRHVPTFFPRATNARPTTIDLTWVNFELTKHKVKCTTSGDSYGSDHQLLLTEIDLGEPPPVKTHNTAKLATLAEASFCNNIENRLSSFCPDLHSFDEIDAGVKYITDSIHEAFEQQGRPSSPAPTVIRYGGTKRDWAQS